MLRIKRLIFKTGLRVAVVVHSVADQAELTGALGWIDVKGLDRTNKRSLLMIIPREPSCDIPREPWCDIEQMVHA